MANHLTSEYRAALRWFATDDTGISSEAIVYAALGIARRRWGDGYPRDPADLGRCLRMLKRMPWAARGIEKLARRNKVWRALKKRWAELEQSMIAEVGIGWEKARSAPRTFDLMDKIIVGAR